MLATDARAVASELLRPPDGHELEFAVLTTFSLDLEALLAIYYATFSDADRDPADLLDTPAELLPALSHAAERVHVFVDRRYIAIPRVPRELFALVERSVHPVRAPRAGLFHPKVWVARYRDVADAEGAVRLRVAVLSRNLTFDRSWDVAIGSEATPGEARTVGATRDLAEFIAALPELGAQHLHESVRSAIARLSDDLLRTRFPSPAPFQDPIVFESLGLGGKSGKVGERTRPWRPFSDASRTIAIAPFVNGTALEPLAGATSGSRVLVSRQEALDALTPEARSKWSKLYVFSERAGGAAEDGRPVAPSALHAKMIGVQEGREVTWWVGSANLTDAAFSGRNVEVVARVRGSAKGKGAASIDAFQGAGFLGLCVPYVSQACPPEDSAAESARERVEQVANAIAEADTRVECTPDGAAWRWQLRGGAAPVSGVEVAVWPITVDERAGAARAFDPAPYWILPKAKLTEFAAFRVHATDAQIDDVCFTLKLPVDGMPTDRDAAIFRTVIDSPGKLTTYLHALLGDDDLAALSALSGVGAAGGGQGADAWASVDGLLERLLRVAAKEPSRLHAFRQAMERFGAHPGEEAVLDPELVALWGAVAEALEGMPPP